MYYALRNEDKMYYGKKISVAMAVYNGERFIQKQIESICNQTIVPDEIVVSDDGSNDSTIDIVKDFAQKYKEIIEIKLLTDNPRHGYCGNFEWVISHSSGDYIFVCDQDDVWYSNKVEEVMKVFDLHPDAECVIHEAELINEEDNLIPGVFHKWTHTQLSDKDTTNGYKLERDIYLQHSVSHTIAPGMATCISKDSLKTSLPFPNCDRSHDQWIEFCAILNDKCWYISSILEGYRLHGNNTSGNSAYRGTKIEQYIKKIRRLNINGVRNISEFPAMYHAMMDLLEKRGYKDTLAYRMAERIYGLGQVELSAFTDGRIRGSVKLYNLYKKDNRYRSIGRRGFLYKVYLILFYSKKKRVKILAPYHLEDLKG